MSHNGKFIYPTILELSRHWMLPHMHTWYLHPVRYCKKSQNPTTSSHADIVFPLYIRLIRFLQHWDTLVANLISDKSFVHILVVFKSIIFQSTLQIPFQAFRTQTANISGTVKVIKPKTKSFFDSDVNLLPHLLVINKSHIIDQAGFIDRLNLFQKNQ